MGKAPASLKTDLKWALLVGGLMLLAIALLKALLPPEQPPTPTPAPYYLPPPRVEVRGYYRKDGTYVSPHSRTAPR